MIELKDELFAAPIGEWKRVPFAENHHKWLLQWQKPGDDGEFFFMFISPNKRRYSFYIMQDGRVTDADVARADGEMIASYWKGYGDKPDRLEAVLRHTPRHIQYRLFVLLDTIKERFDGLCEMHDLFTKYAPTGAELLDFIKLNDEYIVLYRDDANACTPYIMHHLNDSGLYYGHYYDNGWAAYREFHKMK